jgi:hypothetical protein
MADLPTTETQAPPGGVPGLPPDWPQQATNRIVSVIDDVRFKTTGPAIRISRAIVYGLVAAVLALVALPLLLIGLTRFLDWVVPGDVAYVYFIIGAVLCLAGLFLWSKRPKGAAKP